MNMYTDKENIPTSQLKQHDSRRLTTPNKKRSKPQLSQEYFENLIANYKGSNILQKWLKYIEWMAMQIEKGNKTKEDYAKVIRDCCFKLQNLPQYKNNGDYLRVWVTFADLSDDPIQIFSYLQKMGIGQKLALFYQAYSCAMESLNEFESAAAILDQGIKNRAEPIEELEQQKVEFQERLLEALSSMKKKLQQQKLAQQQQYQKQPQARNVILGYYRDRIYQKDGEFSFEEIRAQLPRYAIKKKEREMETQTTGPVQFVQPTPTKTIHTKVAEKDIADMFSAPFTEEVLPRYKARQYKDSEDESQVIPIQNQPIQPIKVFEEQTEVPSTPVLRNKEQSTLTPTLRERQIFVDSKENKTPCLKPKRRFPIFQDAENPEKELFDNQPPRDSITKKPLQPISQSIETPSEFAQQKVQPVQQTPQQYIQYDQENIPKQTQRVLQPLQERDDSPPMKEVYQDEIQPMHDETPVRGIETKRFSSSSMSSIDSPTIHTKMASKEIDAMFNAPLDDTKPQQEKQKIHIFQDDTQSITQSLTQSLTQTVSQAIPMPEEDPCEEVIPTIQKKLSEYLGNTKITNPFNQNLMNNISLILEGAMVDDPRFKSCKGTQPPYYKNLKTRGESSITLADKSLLVENCLHQGTHATVFSVQDLKQFGKLALKIHVPACSWEFYICDQIQRRASKQMTSRFISAQEMYLYDKESFLLLKYSDHGTLQDVINHYKRSKIASKKTMDEYIAMFYTIELLRIVETLHNECNIIHCDIRPENLLILNENCKVWENWTKEGAKGWECKGLKLIDFGNCIDMKLYPKGTMFQGEGPIKCIEMQTGKPWTYQVDMFGLCGVVHYMLHGEPMQLDQKDGKWRPKLAFRKYWQYTLWEKLFDALLNVKDCNSMPSLKELRAMFEDYLTSNPKKAASLKAMLCKQSVSLYDSSMKK